MLTPPDAVILERAKSLCNEACFTVALQKRRLQSAEPEDGVFIFRWWADFQFLIVALYRLRRAAELAKKVSGVRKVMKRAISEFDKSLPNLRKMRDVGEHIDAYAIDAQTRHHEGVNRRQLQVGSWDGRVFRWLEHELDIHIAQKAASKLFQAVKLVAKKTKMKEQFPD